MTSRPIIPEADARAAVVVLMRIVDGEDIPGALIVERAASSLVRMYLTQERYAPTEIGQLAQRPKPSQTIRDLAKLTDEELEALRREMTADFPGKPS